MNWSIPVKSERTRQAEQLAALLADPGQRRRAAVFLSSILERMQEDLSLTDEQVRHLIRDEAGEMMHWMEIGLDQYLKFGLGQMPPGTRLERPPEGHVAVAKARMKPMSASTFARAKNRKGGAR